MADLAAPEPAGAAGAYRRRRRCRRPRGARAAGSGASRGPLWRQPRTRRAFISTVDARFCLSTMERGSKLGRFPRFEPSWELWLFCARTRRAVVAVPASPAAARSVGRYLRSRRWSIARARRALASVDYVCSSDQYTPPGIPRQESRDGVAPPVGLATRSVARTGWDRGGAQRRGEAAAASARHSGRQPSSRAGRGSGGRPEPPHARDAAPEAA